MIFKITLPQNHSVYNHLQYHSQVLWDWIHGGYLVWPNSCVTSFFSYANFFTKVRSHTQVIMMIDDNDDNDDSEKINCNGDDDDIRLFLGLSITFKVGRPPECLKRTLWLLSQADHNFLGCNTHDDSQTVMTILKPIRQTRLRREEGVKLWFELKFPPSGSFSDPW